MEETPPSGYANTPFAGIREAFAQNFAEGAELGASFALFIEGECVADLKGGWSDREKEKPWADDTLACIYSSGKAVIALLIARAVGANLLTYHAPVATWWPEFAANGKSSITLADVLSHQAGLVGIAGEMPPEAWIDRERMTARIAAMAPLFPPRSASGYSPQLVGFIAGELLRRVAGKGVAEMLGDLRGQRGLEIFCGIKGEAAGRAAYMPKPPKAPDLGPLTELKRVAFLKPWSAPAKVSREAWMAAEIPSSNIHSNARSLAEIVHPFANRGLFRGEQLLSEKAIAGALKERIRGNDLVLPFNLSWAAGFMRNINGHFGPNRNAFGHAGFGGSSVLVDPEHRLTAAYVMSKMSPYLVGDPRGVRLFEAAYAAL